MDVRVAGESHVREAAGRLQVDNTDRDGLARYLKLEYVVFFGAQANYIGIN